VLREKKLENRNNLLFLILIFGHLHILEKTRWKRLCSGIKLSKNLALFRHLATKKPLLRSGGEPQGLPSNFRLA